MATRQMTGQQLKKNRSAGLLSTVQSTIVMFCTLFPVTFLTLFFHEGGHALMDIASGGKVDLFYVHPFSFNGYVRPITDWHSVAIHTAGGLFGLVAALVIFLFAWKHRSIQTLSLVMLLPWTAILLGLQIMLIAGDWRNIVFLTGIPEILFMVGGGLITLVGIFLFLLTIPLLGLAPENRQTLLALPEAFVLWSMIGVAVAYLVVPGSTVETKYGLAEEILISANSYPFISLFAGLLLSGLYVSLYRLGYRYLPSWLQTDPTGLTWNDLRLPGLIATACVILGLAIIL